MAEPCTLAVLVVIEVLVLAAVAAAVLSVSADASLNFCVHRGPLHS